MARGKRSSSDYLKEAKDLLPQIESLKGSDLEVAKIRLTKAKENLSKSDMKEFEAFESMRSSTIENIEDDTKALLELEAERKNDDVSSVAPAPVNDGNDTVSATDPKTSGSGVIEKDSEKTVDGEEPIKGVSNVPEPEGVPEPVNVDLKKMNDLIQARRPHANVRSFDIKDVLRLRKGGGGSVMSEIEKRRMKNK